MRYARDSVLTWSGYLSIPHRAHFQTGTFGKRVCRLRWWWWPLRANQPMHALLARPLDSVETAVVGCVDVLERSGSMVKEPPWQRPGSAPAPPQGAPGSAGWLGVPRGETSSLDPLGTARASRLQGRSSPPPLTLQVGRQPHRRLAHATLGQAERHGGRAPLPVPHLGSCASSGRTWRLWAVRHSQRRGRATARRLHHLSTIQAEQGRGLPPGALA